MGRATPPPVEPRPEIAASWARSLRSGVTGDALAPSLAADADPTGRLASLAAPVLDRLSSTLADTRTTVVLTDAHAGVLDRRAGTQPLGDLLDGIGLVPGYSYAEDVVGTNGMGTAAEERRAVLVKGPEHYAEALRPLTCMGVPIEHPVTGRLEGVLDLTCFNEDAGPWMAPLVAEAVAGIRGQLEEDATVAERALFSAFLRASHRASGAVVSLNHSFVLTNPAAARLLDGADHGALWEIGAAAVTGRSDDVQELLLASGSRVHARFEVVEVGERPVGAIVRLAEAVAEASTRTVGSRSGTASRRAAPSSPAGAPAYGPAGVTARLADEVAGALAAGERVLLRGPSGAGKLTVAKLALDHATVPVFDAGRAVVDGARAWLVDVEAALTGGGPVVIRHLEALGADVSAGLTAVLDATPPGVAVIATVAEPGSTVGAPGPAAGPAAGQALADRFDRLVRVPGIADRVEELPGLIRSILGRLAPTGAVRLAPEVVQALTRVDLPGNLRQLEALLHRVVVKRHVGTITLDDLPPEVRAATHRPHLTAMEQHECEAIASALASADGNKAAAASALGISRSTLYRKLEAYGLQLDRRAW
ncbi:GAF domain-containing protein [Aquihabitans sp. G128]|uniref:sigma-54-dependent Fis family transcriptional regulator n=2 Tax=Aquihabitans sp. G128 TaxID=2849779 RepID=UPI001C24497D|nr:helix-turn-helix domain-containing protein [Aquihabitans sp. G128]QXC61243.1 GAF domain-containing protein [Aquihabitans sp. G128]